MAYIKCASGGGGAVEVITGTMTGASGSTSAGEITVTSQQGKSPRQVVFWNANTFTTAYSTGIFWSDADIANARAWYGTSYGGNRPVGAAPSSSAASVKAVGADSITLQCPTTAAYFNGTWNYSVEFE
jgi:hypothetical protein